MIGGFEHYQSASFMVETLTNPQARSATIIQIISPIIYLLKVITSLNSIFYYNSYSTIN